MTKAFEIDLPDSYSKLTDTLDTANKILTTAVDDARTLFHTPVVSSYDGKTISSRVMVLREFNLENRKMRFHTDQRATKINEFSSISSATVIGYDPNLKIQIKLQGTVTLIMMMSTKMHGWSHFKIKKMLLSERRII